MDANAVLRRESGLVSLWVSLVLKGANPCFKPRDLQDPLESMPGFPYCRKITPGGLNLAKGFCFCLKTSGTVTCSYSCLHMGTPLQFNLKILSDLILTPGIIFFMDREINIHSQKGPGWGGHRVPWYLSICV